MSDYLNLCISRNFHVSRLGVKPRSSCTDITEHVYKAGTWKHETGPAAADYNLLGVTPAAQVSPLENLDIPVVSKQRNINRDPSWSSAG